VDGPVSPARETPHGVFSRGVFYGWGLPARHAQGFGRGWERSGVAEDLPSRCVHLAAFFFFFFRFGGSVVACSGAFRA
jgi:hypothetical protein